MIFFESLEKPAADDTRRRNDIKTSLIFCNLKQKKLNFATNNLHLLV